MTFRIIADSSCDIFELERKIDNLYFNTVPFVITVDGKDFVDDEKLDVNELVEAMASSSKSHTSCPSPADWIREFGEEGDVFALTISSNLSGSYNSACTAREMVLEKDPGRNIEILDLSCYRILKILIFIQSKTIDYLLCKKILIKY